MIPKNFEAIACDQWPLMIAMIISVSLFTKQHTDLSPVFKERLLAHI